MARPLPVDYLQPEEEPLLEADRHGASIIDDALGALVLAGLAIGGVLFWTLGFQPQHLVPWGALIMAAVGAVFLYFLVLRWWRVQTSIYVVTDERIYKAFGRFRFQLMQTTYDKVTDLHIKQSIWGRIGGFGTVRVETAGTGVVLDGVRDPFGFKRSIEDARAAFIERLVGEHAPKATKAPKDVAAKTSVEGDVTDADWTGRPTAASMLGGIVAAVLAIVLAGIFSLGALVAGDRAGLAGYAPVGIALLFGVTTLFGVIVRYRYTRFMVQDAGVVVTSGWLTRRRVETRYEKVTDVTVYQNILGRLLGYGNITINTAGSNTAPVVFYGVGDPEDVKAIIDEARDA